MPPWARGGGPIPIIPPYFPRALGPTRSRSSALDLTIPPEARAGGTSPMPRTARVPDPGSPRPYDFCRSCSIESVLETLPDLKILGLTILVPSRPLASLASRLRTLRVPCEATVQEDSQRTSGAPNYPQLLRTPRVPRSPESRKIEQILRTLRDPRKS